ncbi:MAG: glycosyltransferase [Candidatus Pacebacteria bacterium]|nr:glycosyltransferase [Candidatus Paceibacterota bacterium]
MKILFITQFLPFPPDTGGKVKTWRILNLLSRSHELFLISFIDQKKDLAFEKRLKRICHLGIKTFLTPLITSHSPELKVKAILGNLSPVPFRVKKYYLPQAADFIRRLTGRKKFEAVYCDHLTSSRYLRAVKNLDNLLKIYDEHNISSEAFKSQSESERNILKKIAYKGESAKFFLFEREMVEKFDLIFTISRQDRQKLGKLSRPESRVVYLPVPFETEPLFRFGPKVILFVGFLSWRPNEEAAFWFGKKIFPLVLKQVPRSRFWIVGEGVSDRLRKLAAADPKIKLWGHLKSLKAVYRRSGVAVAPIRTGGGVKIKILTALAYGLPVVATSSAVSGLESGAASAVVLAESPSEIARAVVETITNSNNSWRLSEKGLNSIRACYSEKQSRRVLDQIEKASRHNKKKLSRVVEKFSSLVLALATTAWSYCALRL